MYNHIIRKIENPQKVFCQNFYNIYILETELLAYVTSYSVSHKQRIGKSQLTSYTTYRLQLYSWEISLEMKR